MGLKSSEQSYYKKLRADKDRWNKVLTERRAYYQKHKKRIQARSRELYSLNKDYCLEVKRTWRKKVGYRPRYNTSSKTRYAQYIRSAKNRGIVFNLSFKYFLKLILSNCTYCGEPPNPLNGVDRYDNGKGYTKSNSVPCCRDCNWMKGDMSNFVEQCRKVVNYLSKKA